MRYKKNNKPKLLLAIAALLVLFSVAIGVTYSWIEGGTTYTMETLKNSDIKLGDFDETYAGKIILDPTRSDKVILLEYDKTVDDYQSLIFTPVSTADGNDFYFPSSFDAEGNPLSYKVATTNDIGTKFVNFSVDVKAAGRCYLAFNGTPEVVVTKSGKDITDTSAFRVMISSEMHNVSNFFSTGAEGNVDGVTSIAGATSEYALESFSKYQDNSISTVNRLYQYEENDEDTLTVSVWLDSLADYADLCGCDVSLNLQLIVGKPKAPIKFNAVTYDNEGIKDTNNGFTGGKIAGRTEAFTDYAAVGESYTAKATPGANYNFEGWFDNAECNGTPINENKNYTFTVTDASISLFAKFVEKPEYTITVNQKTLPNGTGGSVYIDEAGTTSLTDYDGNTADIYATPEDGYRFLGWYTDESCTGSSVSAEQQYTVTFGENEPKAYYAKFAKEYTVTFNTRTDGTVGGAGGYVNIDSAATTATSKAVTSYYGQTLKLYTKTVEGYNFNGIFKDGVAASLGTTNPTEITVNSDATYFADFTIKTYTVTYKIYTNGSSGSTGGKISFNGSDYFTTDQTKSVKHGETVNFYATPANTSYRLDNIYKTNLTGATISSGTSVKITGNVTYIANFVPSALTTTVYFAPRSGYTDYYAWIWKEGGNNYTQAQSWPGDKMTKDSATGCYKFTFTTGDTGEFRAIISNGSGTQYPAQTGLYADIGGTYFFRSGSPGIVQMPSVTASDLLKATAYAVTGTTNNSSTGGTVKVINSAAGSNAYDVFVKGEDVTFVAEAKSGYNFDGWYTASTGGSRESQSLTYTVNDATEAKTLYARFSEKPVENVTIYFSDSNSYKWDTDIYCHYWGGSTETSWPGVKMTHITTNNYGEKVYSLSIPADTKYIIFNNNSGKQTVDIVFNINNGNGFYVNGQNGNYTVGTYTYPG